VDSGYNPNRTIDLYALTPDGYIIAQDIMCQYDYVAAQSCPQSGRNLIVVAQINRATQGLNELVAISPATGAKYSFIFDISNEVYQTWWASMMGKAYQQLYDGQPRQADPQQRYFTE
jgi:hypothetical protein